MVKRIVKKKVVPKKKSAPKKKVSRRKAPPKKKVVKRKAPAKKRSSAPKPKASRKRSSKKAVSSRSTTSRSATTSKASTKKKSVSKRKPKAKAKTKDIALHKDGTEQFETTDVLFDEIVNRAHRPCTYTKTIGKKICLLISMGYSLTKITSFSDMPCMSTVCTWLQDAEGKPELLEWYSHAREAQVDIVEDRVMDICMDVPKIPLTAGKDGDKVTVNGEVVMINHPANVALAKLQTDSHYKYLASLRAKRWGNNVDLGEGVGNLLQFMDEAAERVANFRRAAIIDGNTGKVINDS